MKLSKCVKPLSYVKAHASEIINGFDEDSSPVVITQNGEATAVLMSIHEYEQLQESIAMMQILEMSKRNAAAGRFEPAEKVFADIIAQGKAHES